MVYALFKNFLNVLYFTFKSAELIYLARNTPYSVLSNTFSLDERRKFGVASIWILRCEVNQHLEAIGMEFLAAATFAMILGLHFEVRSRSKLISAN